MKRGIKDINSLKAADAGLEPLAREGRCAAFGMGAALCVATQVR